MLSRPSGTALAVIGTTGAWSVPALLEVIPIAGALSSSSSLDVSSLRWIMSGLSLGERNTA